jgi:hypothetical protein
VLAPNVRERDLSRHCDVEMSASGRRTAEVRTKVAFGNIDASDPMYGPAVRSKKIFDDLAVSGLASMYPTSDWSVVLRANMDISARAI